jgi:hypothetical protein
MEMRAAVDNAVESGQVQQLENGVVEITTDFTIGDAIEQVRQHIQDVLAACGSTTVEVMDGVTILVDFGPATDPCEFEGKSYSGQVQLVITHQPESVLVEHTYFDLSNGTYTLNGDKDVTWTAPKDGVVERHIVSKVGWDGPKGHVDQDSDRTMTFLDWLGGPTQRIQIDGTRDWTRASEDWHLDIDEVEFRLVDPVPQDGAYVLSTPEGKTASLSFERVDDDTIAVTITGGRRGERVFHVTSSGAVTDETR